MVDTQPTFGQRLTLACMPMSHRNPYPDIGSSSLFLVEIKSSRTHEGTCCFDIANTLSLVLPSRTTQVHLHVVSKTLFESGTKRNLVCFLPPFQNGTCKHTVRLSHPHLVQCKKTSLGTSGTLAIRHTCRRQTKSWNQGTQVLLELKLAGEALSPFSLSLCSLLKLEVPVWNSMVGS